MKRRRIDDKHMDITQMDVDRKIRAIRRGAGFWEQLYNESGITNEDCIVFFPNKTESEFFDSFMEYLPLYKAIRKPARILILTSLNVEEKNDDSIIIKKVDCMDASDILDLYSCHDLGNRFIVASLTEPYGRCADKVMERRGVSLKDVIVYGILGLSREEVKE